VADSLPWDLDVAEPHRLAILVALGGAGAEGLGFPDLCARVRSSEGNVACHLRRLTRTGLVALRSNGARGRASRTTCELTVEGRARLAAARAQFESAARRISAALAAGDRPIAPTPAATVASELLDERFSGPD